MKTNNITEQELNFVHEYVSNGFRGKDAYLAAFQKEGEEMKDTKAYSGSYRLLKKQIIQDAIDAEEGSYKAKAREMDMSRSDILSELKNIVWGSRKAITKDGDEIEVTEDGKTKIAAINTLVKLTGDFSPERKEVDFTQETKIDTKGMTPEKLKELQAALMDEM